MTKTLRVDLADLEGIPHASGPSGTSVVVTAEYTSPVILEADGKIILAPKSKTMGAAGRVDFTGIYTSDSEEVREDHRGFAVRVKVAIREPNGATRTWARTVKPLEHMADTVRLGRMPSAQGLPPQWTTIEELVSKIEEGDFIVGPEGPQGPEGPPGPKGDDGEPGPSGASTIADVTGLTDQLAGSVDLGDGPITFGPGGDSTTAQAIINLCSTLMNVAGNFNIEGITGLEGELQEKAEAWETRDSGWLEIPLEDDWTGLARIRRTGSLVHFHVTNLTGPPSGSLATFAVIPDGFRAGPDFTAHGLGAGSSSTAVGAVAMTATSSGGGPNMSQNVRVSTPSSWSGGAGSIWWHTDEPWPDAETLAAMIPTGFRGGPLSHADIVDRSALWFPPNVGGQIPYDRTAYYPDDDGHTYRQDCSGFVSMCLHADRSYSTRTIQEISEEITKGELVPGDYLVSYDNHIVLFLGWTDGNETAYYARESGGPQGGTVEREVPYPYFSQQDTYVPMRYVNATDESASS